DGTDRGPGLTGVRDRRRGDEGDPAHRRDVAVHLLRRLVDRRQLHPACAAAADLRPRPPGAPGVNAPITKLFGLVLVLFAILVFATSWWTEFGAQRLRDNPLNRRQLLEDAKVKRGRILADDGSVLARSVKAQGDTYRRIYPNNIFSHEVGYSFTNLGRAGLEESRNPALTGQGGEVDTLIDQLSGRKKAGDDVVTNLDPAAQKVALQQLAGRKGSVVALEPS